MRPPAATYRLQLRRGVGFPEARALVPYLHDLGVTHLYLSPVFRAREGSAHGYDVVDPRELDPVLGTEAEFRALAKDLAAAGMGLVLDLVPNHMAADADNPWWWDLLAHGPRAEGAPFFDVDWAPEGAPSLEGKVLLPVLGLSPGRALARGELREEDGVLRYHEHAFPLPPPADGESRDLGARLAAAPYRLAHWRVASRVLNVRRFFDITELVGLRAEDPAVFAETHALALRFVEEGLVDGLRVDHVDGLADPGAYLRRLREGAPDAWIVVEKILGAGEALPEDWPVEGTTGYEFLNAAHALFVDPEGFSRLAAAWRDTVGTGEDLEAVTARSRRDVLGRLFGPELRALLGRVPPELHDAFVDLTLALPVYRTYDLGTLRDRVLLDRAAEAAARTRSRDEVERATELLRTDPALASSWQQFTGPLMAKGFEDTTLYRHTPLASRCDVGADPEGGEGWGDVGGFHAWAMGRARHSPHALSATATHDTKRGEDTRLTIAALSELWEDWLPLQAALVGARPEGVLPQIAILLAQTAVGARPLDGDRIEAYARKAAREAKRATAWRRVDEDYEAKLVAYAKDLVRRVEEEPALRALAERAAFHGALHALTQVVLKIAAPGVPDIYQGTEAMDRSLVDPDNRRPVDFEARASQLADLRDAWEDDAAALTAVLAKSPADGRAKFLVTWRALGLRREHRDLFAHGAYVPLLARGARADRVIAFLRRHQGRDVLVAGALRTVGTWERECGWPDDDDTRVPLPADATTRAWRDVVTGRVHARGESLAAGACFDRLPVALLRGTESGPIS